MVNRKFEAGMFLYLNVFLIIFFCLGCNKPDLSTPESAVKGLYNSVYNGKPDAWVEYITPESREILFKLREIPGIERHKVYVDSPEYLHWEIRESQVHEDNAVVTVHLFKHKQQKSGEVIKIKLKKINGDWLIDIADDLRRELNEKIF